jgi:hypothetical protein
LEWRSYRALPQALRLLGQPLGLRNVTELQLSVSEPVKKTRLRHLDFERSKH